MTEAAPEKPDPLCPECDHPLNCTSKRLVDARAIFEQVQKRLREQPARERKYAVGYGWTPEAVCAARVMEAPDLERIVVAVYPEVADEETGIIVAGRDADGDCYILADYSEAMGPDTSVGTALDAYREHHADVIAGVTNLVGDYLKALLYRVHYVRIDSGDSRAVKDLRAFVPVALHKGFLERFRPVRELYEQGAVHHVGVFPELEKRMFTWMPGDRKPMGRIEALVCAITELESSDGGHAAALPGSG